MQATQLINIAGFIIAITMIGVTLTRQKKFKNKKPFLGLLFLETAFYFLNTLIPLEFQTLKLIFNFCFMLLGMPALYFFTRQIFQERIGKTGPHFLGAMINGPVGFVLMAGFSGKWVSPLMVMIYLFLLLSAQTGQIIFYGKKIKSILREHESSTLWIKPIVFTVIAGYSLIMLVNWLYFIQEISFDLTGKVCFLLPDVSLYLIFIIFLILWTISLGFLWGVEYLIGTRDKQEKYSGRPFPQNQSKIIMENATKAMQMCDSLNPEDINPRKLAELISIPYYLLSRAINEIEKISVSDFIHQFRIEKAKYLLKNELNLTVIEIAYKAGFQSKSTFNAVFKKQSGQTPKEYRHGS